MKNIVMGLALLIVLTVIPMKARCLEEKLVRVSPQNTMMMQMWIITGDARFNKLYLYDKSASGAFNPSTGDYYTAIKGYHKGSTTKVNLSDDAMAMARMPQLFQQGITQYIVLANRVTGAIGNASFTVTRKDSTTGNFQKYIWRMYIDGQYYDLAAQSTGGNVYSVTIETQGKRFAYSKRAAASYATPALFAKAQEIVSAMGNLQSKKFGPSIKRVLTPSAPVSRPPMMQKRSR